MSKNAFNKLGLGDTGSAGTIADVTPSVFYKIKQTLVPMLTEIGHSGVWNTGGAGSWDDTHPFPSSAKKTAGDVDIWIDLQEVKKHLQIEGGQTEVRKAVASIFSQKFITTQSGISVHLAFPSYDNNGEYYQIDLMIVENANVVASHHVHDYSSAYTGNDKQAAISSLINTIPAFLPHQFLYYPMGGCVKVRETGEIVTQDRNTIAQMIFQNNGANSTWLNTVEDMLSHISAGIESSRFSQFREHLSNKNQ